jgi:cytochrome c-type biogenesis protein CcmH
LKMKFGAGKLAQAAAVAMVSLLLLGAGNDARFNELGHQLMCLCGCKQILLECNHVGCSYSERMRGELMAAVGRGDSDSLVLQSFVQKYGATVLAAPTTTGFNRVAWIMPYVALAAGLGLVVFIVRLWKQRTRAPYAPTASVAPAQLDAFRQRARQETEL